VVSSLKIGSTTDKESSATTNATATGDDVTGSDDEDGVTVPSSIVQGTSTSITVNVSNSTGSTAYLNAWIDFNQNGVLTDSGEQVAINKTVATGTSNSNRVLSFTVPAGSLIGSTGVRVRLTSTSSPGPTGASGNGEVEDTLVTVNPSCDGYAISPYALGSWELNSSVNLTLVATPTGTGYAPYTWSKSAGTFPPGLSLSSAGVLSGTLTAKGTYSFTLQVADAYGCTSSQAYKMTVDSGSSYSGTLWISTWGSGSSGYVETFDVKTGARAVVGPTSDSSSHQLTDLAWSPNGKLYGIDFNNIYEIHPSNGSVTRLGKFGNSLNGLVFDADGTPYISSVSDGEIYTFDFAALSTSTTTSLTTKYTAPSTAPNGQSLVSAGDLAWIGDELYYAAAASGFTKFYLYKVPAGASAAVLVGEIKTTTGSSIADVFGLATDGYGTLYAQAGSSLYTLDKTTGIGSTTAAVMSNNSITGGAMSYEFNQVLDDFGDYSTLPLARNTVMNELRLGTLTDYDIPAALNTTATGDDLAWLDDEDGITLPASVVQGTQGVSVTVRVTNTSGSPAFLNAWIDFNNNGVLTDAGEQIINNVTVASGLSNAAQTYTFNVPAGAAIGAVGARFRLTAASNPGATGASGPGEVEDEVLTITGFTTDFGDFSSFPSASSTTNTKLRIGAVVDGEMAATTNSAATGDDTTGSDDEDGVTVPTTIVPGSSSSLVVNVSNTLGSSAYLNAWVDFNRNGVLTDSGEQVASNTVIATGTSNTNKTITFVTPAGAASGMMGVRVRLTSVSSPGSDGADGTGEVEDYVTNSCPNIIVATQTLTAAGVGVPYSFTVSATGGVEPYSWSLVSGALPAGLSLSSSGAISGTPTAATSGVNGVSFDLRMVNAVGCEAIRTFTLKVCPTITLSPSSLANGTITESYSQTVSASGGVSPYVFAVTSGSLPAGLNLNTSTGVISGTPTSTSSQTFALSATDANGCSGSRSYTVTPSSNMDFGDHSALASASSATTSSLRMGAAVDAESSATTNATATGDDITGIDDEDGVTMPASLDPGATVTIPVTVTNNTGASGYLHAWIDFNGDGAMNNATLSNGGERLEVARVVPSASTGTILREYWTGIGGTSISDLTSNAAYPNNPTSYDYRANFTAPVDWADNMGQRMRGWLYPPVTGDYTFWVSGDDETKLYLSTDETPENAVLIANVPGWTSSLLWTKYSEQKSVTITLQAGRAYYIEGIMKEGGGGDSIAAAWELPGTSTGPVVIDGQYLAPWTTNGPFNSTQQITFTVPVTASSGANRAVRFRFSDSLSTGPTGVSGVGEVEDYAVAITAPPADYGDFNLFTSASSDASSSLRMGALVDSEATVITNTTATGDDVNGVDDEDGVTVPTTLIRGAGASLTVNVTNSSGSTAYLNAWIDFNGNGSLADAGEQIATNTSISSGVSNSNRTINFTTPGGASLGTIGVRVRLTSVASPGKGARTVPVKWKTI
jgi:hypothetical protein